MSAAVCDRGGVPWRGRQPYRREGRCRRCRCLGRRGGARLIARAAVWEGLATENDGNAGTLLRGTRGQVAARLYYLED